MKSSKMIVSIIAALLALILSQLFSQVIANLFLVIGVPEFVCNLLAGLSYLVFAYFMVKMFIQKYLKEKIEDFYMPGFRLSIKWLIAAFLLPLAVSAVYLFFFDGSFTRNDISFNEEMAILSAGIFFTGIGAGFVEEIIFRGVIMNVLNRKYNRKIAVIIPSLLFGCVHIIGMNFNLLSCLLVIFAGTAVGIMFSLIAISKKSVWNSAIVHSIWNIIIIGGGLWIGTAADEYSIFSFVIKADSFALTGGEFGIESSLISLAAYCLVSVVAYLSIIREKN